LQGPKTHPHSKDNPNRHTHRRKTSNQPPTMPVNRTIATLHVNIYFLFFFLKKKILGP
jgi:hypothetical protein